MAGEALRDVSRGRDRVGASQRVESRAPTIATKKLEEVVATYRALPDAQSQPRPSPTAVTSAAKLQAARDFEASPFT